LHFLPCSFVFGVLSIFVFFQFELLMT
jgi:hypothetical protein